MLEQTAFINGAVKWSELNVSGELVAFVLLTIFALLSVLECVYPSELWPGKSIRRSYKTNISLFLFNSVVASVFSVALLLTLLRQFSGSGLLSYLPNTGLQALISFIVLDLLLYAWHRACHQFGFLWMFHRVHHNEPFLNISTAFRVHVLELLITNILKAGYIVALGVDQLQMLINEALLTLFVMFHHANISFKGEKLLGLIVITPYLHRSHHSIVRSEHDSNYGAVFSCWDCLFGTLNRTKAKAIGISEASPKGFINLLKFGFTPIRSPRPSRIVDLDFMIAEAAYYKAEKRNFRPGNELRDWLEAKNDIIQLVYGENWMKKKRMV